MTGEILVVGAGREGKGFIGEAFFEAGWKVSFLDKDSRVVENLQKGSYEVKLHKPNCTVIQTVDGYSAYKCDEAFACRPTASNADIIALCLYPEDIPEAARYLAVALSDRAATNGKPLSIISCTNKNHMIDDIRAWFREGLLNEPAKDWFDQKVVVRDAIVRRSTDAKNNYDLFLESVVIAPLLVQEPLNVDVQGVEQIELTDNLEQLKEIKLYTINAPHATCAYAGYLKGYRTIPEAEADPGIFGLMQRVVDHSILALSREYGIEESRLRKFATLAKPLEEMPDELFRVCVDPIRKLSRNDRLTGNALYCIKHGIDPDPFCRSIANAMMYSDSRDGNAVRIQELRKEKGDLSAVSEICGISEDSPLAEQVAAYMEHIRRSGQPML